MDSAVAYVVSPGRVDGRPGLYEDARSAASIVAARVRGARVPGSRVGPVHISTGCGRRRDQVSALADSNTTDGFTDRPGGSLLPQWSYPDPVTWGDTLIPERRHVMAAPRTGTRPSRPIVLNGLVVFPAGDLVPADHVGGTASSSPCGSGTCRRVPKSPRSPGDAADDLKPDGE